jgi:hypothetical protein
MAMDRQLCGGILRFLTQKQKAHRKAKVQPLKISQIRVLI